MADLLFRVRWTLWAWHEGVYVGLGLWIARRLPRWIRYWVTIDSISRATTGQYGNTVVPELPAMEVLNRI